MLRPLAIFSALIAFTSFAVADDAADQKEKEHLKDLVAGLQFKQGTITLDNGLAKLNIPDDFSYLDAKDTKTVLSDIWGNPPQSHSLGLIVPKEFNPLKQNSWAVVISYDESGFVKDGDADSIDYSKVLKDMQASILERNADREKQGYGALKLVGWAAPPHYDKEAHKIYWAKELEFDGDPDHTLNYCIRVLGRKGVLELNAIAAMGQLPQIEKEMPAVISMVDFQEGHRYVDFDPKVDKIAGYGLAALVAGGIAAKAGLFKGLFVMLLAFKKFVVIGVVAVIAAVKKFFKRA
ncbi:DUF2167 domain-containing protein [soil metagenome]